MSETENYNPVVIHPAGPLPEAGGPCGWRVPPRLESLGEVKDSALLTPHFLLRRDDGQVVQVSELLHTVLERLDPDQSADEIADAVSTSYGRRLTPDGLRHLVEARLMPLGLVDDVTGPRLGKAPVAKPVLSLAMRGTLVPTREADMGSTSSITEQDLIPNPMPALRNVEMFTVA